MLIWEMNKMTITDFTWRFEELMDDALNNLSPEAFKTLVDNIAMMLDDYED